MICFGHKLSLCDPFTEDRKKVIDEDEQTTVGVLKNRLSPSFSYLFSFAAEKLPTRKTGKDRFEKQHF